MKMLGYFTNILSKLNRYIERENSALHSGSAFVRELALRGKFPNKAGADIPRFTTGQIRLMVRYLERKESFRFQHAIDCRGRKYCHCDAQRVQEFQGIVRSMNKKLPSSLLEALI